MIMLLNPGTKRRKRKYSSRLKRRYKSRRRGRTYKRRGGWICRTSKKCRRYKKRHRISAKLRAASTSGFMGHVKSFVYPTAANGRRRRRGRNGRRHRARNSPHWGFGQNPSAAMSVHPIRGRSFMKSISAPFDARLLMSTIPFLSGFMLNGYTAGFIGSVLPAFLTTGYASYLTGLLGAGTTASLVGMVSPSSFSGSLLGGVSQVAVRFFRDVVMPKLPGGFTMMLTGMSDYLTVGDARRARPLNGMGDYLTVGDARRARPLNGMEDYDDGMDGLGHYEGVPTGEMVDSEILAYEG